MKYRTETAGESYEIDVALTPRGYVVRGPDGEGHLVQLQLRQDGSQRAITPWGEFEVLSARRGAELWSRVEGRRLLARVERVRVGSDARGNARVAGSAGRVCSPMAGKLLRLDVRLGDTVERGQALAVVEAMKMENELAAPVGGLVVEVAVSAPCSVDKGTLLIRIDQPSAGA